MDDEDGGGAVSVTDAVRVGTGVDDAALDDAARDDPLDGPPEDPLDVQAANPTMSAAAAGSAIREE